MSGDCVVQVLDRTSELAPVLRQTVTRVVVSEPEPHVTISCPQDVTVITSCVLLHSILLLEIN